MLELVGAHRRRGKKRNEIALKNVCSSDRVAFGGAWLARLVCMYEYDT